MTDKSIYDLIRDAIAKYPLNDDSTVAIAVLNDLHVEHKTAEILLPLVTNAVAGIRRTQVRHLEQRAFARSDRDVIPDEVAADMVQARIELLEEAFVLPDGRWIHWAKATIEEHEARIAMLETKRAGLARTIERHQAAIELIRGSGTTCLGDIYGAG